MMPTDCLLIFPYFEKYDPTQRKQRSPFPPLGLLYVGGALQRAGYSVELLDCSFLPSLAAAKNELLKRRAKVVGIHSMVTLTRNGMELARAAKEAGMIVLYGGPDATSDPEKYLRFGLVDYVVIGEGEKSAVELMNCITNGREPKDVRGIAYRNERGEVVKTPPREMSVNLDALPFPERHLMNNDEYIRVWREDHGYAMTSIITTRGCPYGCYFCSEKLVWGRRYSVRGAKNVVDELEDIVRVHGYDRVWFADDIFPLIKKRTIEICDEIVNRGLKFTWSCLARPDLVDLDSLRAMKRAGCDQIFFGVESGSQQVLDAMNRMMTVQEIIRGTSAAKEAGLKIHTFMMVGFPGETYSSIIETIKLMKRMMPDEFSFTVAYPLPGTELFHMVEPTDEDFEWADPGENKLLFKSSIPEWALKFAIWKAKYEYYAHKRAKNGERIYGVLGEAFRVPTDLVLRLSVPNTARIPKINQCEVATRVVLAAAR